MISPFNPLKIKSGENASAVNDCSIWNSQFRICLLNLTQNLENAIQYHDGRDVEYFLGLINRCKYHPILNWTTLVPIDLLLLPKAQRKHRKGHKGHRTQSQHLATKRRRGSISTSRAETPPISSTEYNPIRTARIIRTAKKKKTSKSGDCTSRR